MGNTLHPHRRRSRARHRGKRGDGEAEAAMSDNGHYVKYRRANPDCRSRTPREGRQDQDLAAFQTGRRRSGGESYSSEISPTHTRDLISPAPSEVGRAWVRGFAAPKTAETATGGRPGEKKFFFKMRGEP